MGRVLRWLRACAARRWRPAQDMSSREMYTGPGQTRAVGVIVGALGRAWRCQGA